MYLCFLMKLLKV